MMKKALLGSLALALAGAPAYASIFAVGDVFASIGNGLVEVHQPNGTLVTTLDTGLGGLTTGSTTDSAGNFFVTAFSSSQVAEFDTNGNLVTNTWAGNSINESIVFNAAGQALVSSVARSYSVLRNLRLSLAKPGLVGIGDDCRSCAGGIDCKDAQVVGHDASDRRGGAGLTVIGDGDGHTGTAAGTGRI
jgi:hypothetical protein